MHSDTTNSYTLLSHSMAFIMRACTLSTVHVPTSQSEELQCPCCFPPFFQFPSRNKYNYLIMGSVLIKAVLRHSVGGAKMLDGEKLQVKCFLLSLLLFICKLISPPIYLLLQVFRQGLKLSQPTTTG